MTIINKNIFRAYDIRGVYPDEINEEAVFLIGGILANIFKNGKVVIGQDVRLSSEKLSLALIGGIQAQNLGCKIIKAGLITTPMLYFLVNNLDAKGGIMVTASHNPKEYNGLKVVGEHAIPISGEEIQKLLKLCDKLSDYRRF